MVPVDLWNRKLTGTTDEGSKELEELFNGKVFDFPKPHRLIKRALEIVTCDDDIILDFFSGTSSTAHAVLELNKEDGGNRNFIMVQLPEPCDENPISLKNEYKTIADIGKERIRRVIKKIDEEQKAKIKGAGDQLPGFEDEQPQLDLGFKVFKLDRSNFTIWDGSNTGASEEEIVQQLQLHIDHIDPAATQEDILYELLLKAGFMPTQKVKNLEMAGKMVFSIAEGDLLICLENDITRELIDVVAEAEPKQFICLDEGFRGNDQLKANAVQTFAARNQGREKAEHIVFRTV